MKKKIETNGIHIRKLKLTLAVLICIFALVSVSAAVSEKVTWIASLEKNGDSILFADHDESETEGGWIQLSGGKEIQLPEPLSFSYCGTDTLEKAGTTLKLNPELKPNTKPDSDKEKDTELKFTYPYSTHPFYTEDQKVTMDYNGPSAFKKQEVNVYLVKGIGVSSTKEAIDLVGNGTNSLEEIFKEGTGSYTKICATLDKNGDLTEPLALGCLEPGSYGILITLADDKDKQDKAKDKECGMENKVLSATCFEVVDYELKTDTVNTLEEGDNLDVELCLEDAPTKGEYTYGALLINEEAYKAEINVSSNGTMDGTDIFVNDVDLRNLAINTTNSGKSEITKGVQTFIGEGNGAISIGEINQDTLSLTTFDLKPGNYLLFTGAYEKGKGLVGIDQKEIPICIKGTSPI